MGRGAPPLARRSGTRRRGTRERRTARRRSPPARRGWPARRSAGTGVSAGRRMDRRGRRKCPGLGRAVVEAGLMGAPRRERVPGLPSRDYALLRRGRGRDRGPDRCGYRPPAPVGPPRGCPPTALALGRRVRDRDRRESPLPRLAGILRFATVPSLERAVVLRRLDRNRRSL